MNEQALLERIRNLPPDKQEAVKHFVEEIEHKNVVTEPRRTLMGALADLNLHVTEEDIDAARISSLAGKYIGDPMLSTICDEAYQLRDSEPTE